MKNKINPSQNYLNATECKNNIHLGKYRNFVTKTKNRKREWQSEKTHTHIYKTERDTG